MAHRNPYNSIPPSVTDSEESLQNLEKRLWMKVPPASSGSKIPNSMRMAPVPVRPTVTTLLRHSRVVEEKEQTTKRKIEAIVAGKTDFDFEAWRLAKSLEEKRFKEAQESKRILKSKLAYHKAIEATKNVQCIKSEQANSLRYEAQKMRHEHSVEQEAEMERRRALASEVQEELQNCRKTIENLYMEKRRQADEFKLRGAKLREEKRRKEFEDLASKKLKIQKIQATKMALRAANVNGFHSNASIIGAIGSPESEIRLKMAREQEQLELEEKRRKVKETNDQRFRKIAEMREKLETHVAHSITKRRLNGQFRQLPQFRNPLSQDGEMCELITQLKKFTGDRDKDRDSLGSGQSSTTDLETSSLHRLATSKRIV